MNEEMRLQYDEGDGLKIGASAQFLTETAVRLIEAMGVYRNEVEQPADEGSAARMKAIREALEFSWAGTYRAMAEIAWVMRFEPQEAIENLDKALEEEYPANDNAE